MAMSPKPSHISFAAFVVLMGFGMMASQTMSRSLQETSMQERHEQWMARYGRRYNSSAEKQRRFMIFKKSVEFVEKFNSAVNRSYTLGVHQFADLTEEEFLATHTGYSMPFDKMSTEPTPFRYESMTDVPSRIDWRERGAVTSVKHQHECGCCWAFSAVAAIEGIIKLKYDKLISLSEQQLVDCNTYGMSRGCGGGWMNDAFNYVLQNQGISSEETYPYQGFDGNCDTQRAASPSAKISGYENVPSNDEASLLNAVANQPVSITIDASGEYFMHYNGGIFRGPCGSGHNHAVTIVGYGVEENGAKYWLIKNSWGEQWGENGYMRLQRDYEDPRGLCGIAMYPTYPTA
ncbi:ervatamin-B-like [Malania oleifera]|uniref:ervatamin-B-like n=1 Tax=Malania oleifera TaxID=397392 RepID=UPI0025ADE560|nr:ervatamin-B-like [Malania oleifera]